MSAPIIDSLPLPPHSQEAEHALLGALLANPEAFHLIEPPLEPGDFYSYANRLIYQAIFSLASQGKPADVLTVSDLLREIGNEKETGGLEYLNRLTESYASAANLSEYARIVKDKALKRNLISKLAQLEAEVNSDRGASSEDLLDRVQSEFLKMGLGKIKKLLPLSLPALFWTASLTRCVLSRSLRRKFAAAKAGSSSLTT